jgi:DNA replication protein DnaC
VDHREGSRPHHEAKVCAFPTLALAGTPGSGKTHLATSALRVLAVEGGCSIAAWPVVDLLSAVKARFDRPELPDPIARCVSADVLLLDDLGAHHRTEWSVQTLYDLISRRYNRNPDGLLILTTNAATADADAFWRGLLADQSNPQVARIADRIRGALVRMHDDDHGPIPSYR